MLPIECWCRSHLGFHHVQCFMAVLVCCMMSTCRSHDSIPTLFIPTLSICVSSIQLVWEKGFIREDNAVVIMTCFTQFCETGTLLQLSQRSLGRLSQHQMWKLIASAFWLRGFSRVWGLALRDQAHSMPRNLWGFKGAGWRRFPLWVGLNLL